MEIINYFRVLEVSDMTEFPAISRRVQKPGTIIAITCSSDNKGAFNFYILENGVYVEGYPMYALWLHYTFTRESGNDLVNFVVEQVFPPEVPVLTVEER